jgi:hypothetical protein
VDGIILWLQLSQLLLLWLRRLLLRLNRLLLLWLNILLLLMGGTARCQLPNGEMTSSALVSGTVNVNNLQFRDRRV